MIFIIQLLHWLKLTSTKQSISTLMYVNSVDPIKHAYMDVQHMADILETKINNIHLQDTKGWVFVNCSSFIWWAIYFIPSFVVADITIILLHALNGCTTSNQTKPCVPINWGRLHEFLFSIPNYQGLFFQLYSINSCPFYENIPWQFRAPPPPKIAISINRHN